MISPRIRYASKEMSHDWQRCHGVSSAIPSIRWASLDSTDSTLDTQSRGMIPYPGWGIDDWLKMAELTVIWYSSVCFVPRKMPLAVIFEHFEHANIFRWRLSKSWQRSKYECGIKIDWQIRCIQICDSFKSNASCFWAVLEYLGLKWDGQQLCYDQNRDNP